MIFNIMAFDIGIFKNPIILGILGATLTYLYIYWQNEKKHKKNSKAKKKPVSFITPGVVGVFIWFISSNLNIYGGDKKAAQIKPKAQIFNRDTNCKLEYNITNKRPEFYLNPNNQVSSEGSFGSKSYHLISKNNIRLPSTDVFIDLAKF